MLLPGGPGQSGLDSVLATVQLAARLSNHDFVAFDPRGTGESGRLRCKALARGRRATAPERCARELGPRRGYYRSYDTVEDIEAVRAALGSPRLTLLSVSYGARVAGEYVRRHPEAVVRQIMDSPSPLAGTDPFGREALLAQPRVLDALKPGGARAVSRLAARLGKRPLRGRVFTAKGKAKRARASQATLFGTLVDGDLDPVLRGQIPAAATSALRGDGAPLLRLAAAQSSATVTEADVSFPLFLATTCSESALPWDTSQPPAPARERQATAELRRLGRAPFAPFSPLTVVGTSGLLGQCLGWPAVPKAPPLPAGTATSQVPTLVLQGAEDTRTPLEQSRGIAATYAGSTLLTIPFAGHSVLGTDPSDCTVDAAVGFLTRGAAPAPCPARPRPLESPVANRFPRTLRSLKGSLRARSTTAGLLTVSDVLVNFPAGVKSIGGLRGGRATGRGDRDPPPRLPVPEGRARDRVDPDRPRANGVGPGTDPRRRIPAGPPDLPRRPRVHASSRPPETASAATVTRWSPPPRRARLRPRF